MYTTTSTGTAKETDKIAFKNMSQKYHRQQHRKSLDPTEKFQNSLL